MASTPDSGSSRAATWATRDLHVGASDRQCIRHVAMKLIPELRYNRACRPVRHKLYRMALAEHHAHQALVRELRL